jgi:hypothetical protein
MVVDQLMRPILDPFRPVVFALKYCPHGESYRSPPSNRQPPTANGQLTTNNCLYSAAIQGTPDRFVSLRSTIRSGVTVKSMVLKSGAFENGASRRKSKSMVKWAST